MTRHLLESSLGMLLLIRQFLMKLIKLFVKLYNTLAMQMLVVFVTVTTEQVCIRLYITNFEVLSLISGE